VDGGKEQNEGLASGGSNLGKEQQNKNSRL